MASKIGSARLAASGYRLIKAEDYVHALHGPAHCPDVRCLCRLRGVPATQRNVDGAQIPVAAYFGLPRNAEKNGLGHTARCRYNVEACVRRLVARSSEIRRIDKDAEPLLAGTPNGMAEFRLHILMQLLGSGAVVYSERDGGLGGKKPRTGTVYIKTDHVLLPYFRMAKALLSLISRVQERPELERWIRLRYAEHVISWSDYFYETSELERLHRYLLRYKQTIGTKDRSRPAAIAVHVDDKKEVYKTRFGSWAVSCRTHLSPTGSKQRTALMPTLYIKDEKLAARVHKWGTALVCAVPTTEPLQPAPKPHLSPFARINLPVIHASQVCRYNVSRYGLPPH